MKGRVVRGRWVDIDNNATALGCGAEVVRVRLHDGRVLVGRSRTIAPAVFAFTCFGEHRPRRVFLDRVRVADVVQIPRYRDLVAVTDAQRRGDFTGRALRVRANAAGEP